MEWGDIVIMLAKLAVGFGIVTVFLMIATFLSFLIWTLINYRDDLAGKVAARKLMVICFGIALLYMTISYFVGNLIVG